MRWNTQEKFKKALHTSVTWVILIYFSFEWPLVLFYICKQMTCVTIDCFMKCIITDLEYKGCSGAILHQLYCSVPSTSAAGEVLEGGSPGLMLPGPGGPSRGCFVRGWNAARDRAGQGWSWNSWLSFNLFCTSGGSCSITSDAAGKHVSAWICLQGSRFQMEIISSCCIRAAAKQSQQPEDWGS